MANDLEILTSRVRDVPDFPKAGIMFKDITPLLSSAEALARSIDLLAAPYEERGITKVAAIESRGFIFGSAVAIALGCGFIPIRKPGKLPWTTRRHEYTLEYGSGTLEIHDDAVVPGDRVLIIDDVLATGGTAEAAAALLSGFGGTIEGFGFLVELDFLKGRLRLAPHEVQSILHY